MKFFIPQIKHLIISNINDNNKFFSFTFFFFNQTIFGLFVIIKTNIVSLISKGKDRNFFLLI